MPIRGPGSVPFDTEETLPRFGGGFSQRVEQHLMGQYTKAAIVRAVRGGAISGADACSRYMISAEELSLWELALADEGLAGLCNRRLAVLRRESPGGAFLDHD
jgi:hypothetical protein